MGSRFEEFMKPLKETHFALGDYVDFHKAISNVDAISIKLNQLNYLLGQQDMERAVNLLWKENPKVFSVLDILIAVRRKAHKKVLTPDGETCLISNYFKSPDQVLYFLNDTGLTEVFQKKQIKNLVDYVFGIEVGLDTNARKNRSGHIMEALVAKELHAHGIIFEREVDYKAFPEVKRTLGKDKKRFDFVIRANGTTYLMEVNFYAGGGSKLNEVARSYTELAHRINSIPGFEFVWITDGTGWQEAMSKLEEAFSRIPHIYNLTTFSNFLDTLNDKT